MRQKFQKQLLKKAKLIYRGYPVAELAKEKSFEEVAHLLLRGELPSEGELKEFFYARERFPVFRRRCG